MVREKNQNNEKAKDENKEVGYIKPREITAEMQESYLDYAMSVIVSRALPDARDGLKPVHRRILYAMYDMGLRANVKFRKSATVVGECFVKDTNILTEQGIKPIQDICSGDRVFTQNGIKAVSQLYEMPERPLLKVILDNGLSNVATLSQKFKVLNSDWNFIWKEAKELTENDFVVIKADYPDIKSKARLKQIEKGQPQYLNENLAYFLGLFVSEGSISNDYGKKKYPRISIANNDRGIIEKAATVLEKEFFYSPTIEAKQYQINKRNGDLLTHTTYCIRIDRKAINDFFVLNFGLAGKKALTKEIPTQIFISPKTVIFSLISGLIDGDGSIHSKRKNIHYGSISEKLVDQLMIILLSQGIFSHKLAHKCSGKNNQVLGRVVKNIHKFYYLEIHGDNSVKLSLNLQLGSKDKDLRAKRLISEKFTGQGFNTYDLIPYGSKMLFGELSENHLGGGWYQDAAGDKFRVGIKHRAGCKIRYCADLMEKPLRKTQVIDWGIQEKLSKIGSPLFEFLDNVIKNKIYFLRVSSIEKIASEKTYDFQVEQEHEFVANGMVVHNCLGKYHPHGDMAVYDSMVRMAQDFSLRYPLVKGQGNFGSVDGDNAAASRYTEAKMSPIGEEMLADIEKDTVNFIANYDGTRTEPAVLPSPLPQLLLNGSFGIAVGMATSIPTHNVSEVLQSTIHLLENPGATTEDLFQFFQGPDFPTGGIIYGKKDIIAAYSQGKGPILTRGKAEIEETKKGNSIIVITEIPFQVQKSALVMQMAKLVEDKRVEGIKDIRDESGRDGMRIVIELKKEAFPKKTLNALFKYTDLQKTFHLNMIALVDGIQPRVLGLVDVLSFYLKHKEEVVVRRTKFDLQKAKDRAHILEGLMIALKNIDEVIKVIKQSASREDAKINLQKRFKFTDIQAVAILEMRLAQLAKLERDKIEKELAEIEQLIKELNLILSNPKKLKGLIKSELAAMAEKYKDIRRTKVMAGRMGEIGDEDLIPQEEAIITITQGGFIKRMKSSAYHTQKRGGKGVAGMEVNEEDIVEHFVVANTLDKMMFFTDSGKIFQCFAWEIPELTRISKGRGLLNFIEIAPQDKVLSLISYTKKDEDLVDKFLVMATKDGIIKKTILSAFKNVRKNGLLAVKLQPGDSLRSAKIADKDDEISLITKNGQSIRFKESDVRPMGRGASGVKGMKIGKADEVIAMDVIKIKNKNEKKNYLLVITENGYGKRTPIEEYRLQHRGGSGIKAAKINEKTGKIVFAKILEPDDEDLIVISKKGQVIRSALKAISIHGRVASGVRVMRLASSDKVASGTCLSAVLAAEEPAGGRPLIISL
ncbi:hypothetical protein COX74_03075 [bacterium (Candidatus Gribaldobacteria) CG_4_10_14_0_2_um_filter_41_16]|uniref:DNA gyrase subunit A n=2 Tax=Candidatus Gribaldobacteria TaxID=2798536 RepID=A0A2M7VHT5_9BACT|nr:MAG: hypothetical protein AUJ36_03710 [Parcubacteria group bacterium CG1_02_41_26]PJA01370.1 MAG: hypothetical protein COX74_03075 [bacterium (Candidatus Gribaldobacteria) CG_4_10_14_0_2_um_filter_41_16]